MKGCFLAVLCASVMGAQRMGDFQVPKPVAPGSTIVIGYLGGFEHWNDAHRGVRKVVMDLREKNIPGLYAETVENRHRDRALKLIKRAIIVKEKHRKQSRVPDVRVILYGQSWGGAAVIWTAGELKKLGVDVALTVQVDSVGLHDKVVPANVAAAANIFQRDPLTIDGRKEIRAEDPSRTHIIENTQLTYLFRPYDTLAKQDASWVRRTLGGSHAKLEADETVWRHVEDLILQAIDTPRR